MTDLTHMHCETCEAGVAQMTREEAAAMMGDIAGWTLAEDAKSIHRDYAYKDFVEAFAFLTKVAALAEQEQHHPEIWNSWNKVKLTLSTHDVGGLSTKDFILAAKISAL